MLVSIIIIKLIINHDITILVQQSKLVRRDLYFFIYLQVSTDKF